MSIWRIRYTDRALEPRSVYKEFTEAPSRTQIAEAVVNARTGAGGQVAALSANDPFFERLLECQGCEIIGIEVISHLSLAKS